MGIYILITSGILLTIGDILMKLWIDKNNTSFFGLGLLTYFVSMFLLSLSYKYEKIAVASTIIEIINTVTIVIIFTIYFKEKITPVQCFGLILGIFALALLKFGR